MHVESIYQRSWVHEHPVSRWVEYLKINGGAARIEIRVEESHCKAVLSVWAYDHGYQPFVTLIEADIRKQTLEQSRAQLLEITEEMLRTNPYSVAK